MLQSHQQVLLFIYIFLQVGEVIFVFKQHPPVENLYSAECNNNFMYKFHLILSSFSAVYLIVHTLSKILFLDKKVNP